MSYDTILFKKLKGHWNYLIFVYFCNFISMLFMSMKWDYVSKLRPVMGLLFIPQYKCGEPQWNDINRENWRTRRKNLSRHSVHHKSHMDWPRPLQW
jgi:hypothetical protein